MRDVMVRFFKNWYFSFSDIFSFRDDKSKGRVIQLSCSLLSTFYNVFITGIFYTGIMTLIPYAANLLSGFSPRLLSRFTRRKSILLAAKTVYYLLYIVMTTMMPQFVTDPQARKLLFIVIIAVATGFYALFGTGFTTWFYNFYPADNERRTRYLTLLQIFSSILSSVILMTSGLITDALSNSPYQNQLILFFRYFAFALVIVENIIQIGAKEYPYKETENIKLREVFTLPFGFKKYILCSFFMFGWCYLNNLNNGLWQYHLLNNMKFSYTLINAMSVTYTVVLLLFSPVWRKLIRRYSWIKTFGIAMILFVPTEFLFFSMAAGNTALYVTNSIIQNIVCVGINLAYANILYMNLPEENSTAHLTFNSIGCNVFAFFGMVTGTWISSWYEGFIVFLGMEIYAVQWTTIARAILLTAGGIFLCVKWRIFTRDSDIADVELLASYRNRR